MEYKIHLNIFQQKILWFHKKKKCYTGECFVKDGSSYTRSVHFATAEQNLRDFN